MKTSTAKASDISPELAAQIVKNYILPMFETQEKKHLRNKYNKMSSIATSTIGRKFKFDAPDQKSSVYGELKLSEQLANELQAVRD